MCRAGERDLVRQRLRQLSSCLNAPFDLVHFLAGALATESVLARYRLGTEESFQGYGRQSRGARGVGRFCLLASACMRSDGLPPAYLLVGWW